MGALDQYLVDRAHGLIKLLDPPFDTTAVDPGYIKGYLPGVRENGGQYTHAAIWAAMAFAALGDAQRTCELLDMILPTNHSMSQQASNVFKAEPYVVSADVYSVEPHCGRGGWSWYTGSAAWLYRLITESLLGLRLRGQMECLDLLQRLQKAQDDLQRIFESVRSYAAPIHLQLSDCDLSEVWREAWEDLKKVLHFVYD